MLAVPLQLDAAVLQGLAAGIEFAIGDGGAVSVDGNAVLTKCTFSDNTAIGNGGGLFVTGEAMLTDTVFSSNRAANGGGAAACWLMVGWLLRPWRPQTGR